MYLEAVERGMRKNAFKAATKAGELPLLQMALFRSEKIANAAAQGDIELVKRESALLVRALEGRKDIILHLLHE